MACLFKTKALKSSSLGGELFLGGGVGGKHTIKRPYLASSHPGFGFEQAPNGPTVPFRFKGFWTLGCCVPGQK